MTARHLTNVGFATIDLSGATKVAIFVKLLPLLFYFSSQNLKMSA